VRQSGEVAACLDVIVGPGQAILPAFRSSQEQSAQLDGAIPEFLVSQFGRQDQQRDDLSRETGNQIRTQFWGPADVAPG
jgi:hypothetical protein